MKTTCSRSSGKKSDSRRSPDEVFLQPESGMKSGSRRSPSVVKNLIDAGGGLSIDRTWECC